MVCLKARQGRLVTLGHTGRGHLSWAGYDTCFSSATKFSWQTDSAQCSLPEAAPSSEGRPKPAINFESIHAIPLLDLIT